MSGRLYVLFGMLIVVGASVMQMVYAEDQVVYAVLALPVTVGAFLTGFGISKWVRGA